MSITVYWTCTEDEWLRAKEPESVYKNFVQNVKDNGTAMHMCPATKDYMKNTFSIKSIYDYEFNILKDNNDQVLSSFYDQNFFNKHVNVRSLNDKLFSFSQNFVFFTEEKSLLMSASMTPYMEDNNITKRCVTIPGTIDIGRWFRSLDFAFFLKNEYDNFKIEEEEIFQYIKFHTNEKIIFKQFRVSEKINEYLKDTSNARQSRILRPRTLNDYYKTFNDKKNVIKEIKNNLLGK